eukprot:TRINITY_DN15_c0_g1_i4.p1 TRINITY_DN15_c0_g1~~TRINITY_DN15_c0_g1_i4.p1  ORF type:complete len:1108 (+),score=287.35 TRINITY_DN15_c0_g1_i4:71-3394(+)
MRTCFAQSQFASFVLVRPTEVMASRVVLLLIAAIAVVRCQQTTTYSFANFGNVNDLAKFQLNGDAAYLNPTGDGRLSLTYATTNSVGSAFFKNSIPLTGSNGFKGSFSTVFSFQMPNAGGGNDSDGPGADGITFVINSLTNVVGQLGGGMGYGGLQMSVAVELDSWYNGGTDYDGNHVGIDVNGDLQAYPGTVANYPYRFNDGNQHWVWIDYNGDTQIMQVRVAESNNRPLNPLVSRSLNLPVILGSPNVYVGFAAATGSVWERHLINSWTFTNTYAPIVTLPPVVCGNGIIESGEQCDGGDCCTSSCTFKSSGTLCRGSSGACDVAEYCSGTNFVCPADSFLSSATVCRASNGPCDNAEYCPGNGVNCPADSFKASSTVCRASNGPCDVAETCPGNGAACPGDSFQSSSTVCRSSTGICDATEFCSGGAAACPADGAANSGSMCRVANGDCDVAEYCNGVSTTCPADGVASSSTVCRNVAGSCDVAEYCNGGSKTCPADSFVSSSTVCRGSNGFCDVAEYCPGNGASCPADSFKASSTLCRDTAGPCDVAEFCPGNGATCPGDSFQSSSTVCRSSTGICDATEFCSGGAAACPSDAAANVGAECRAATGDCDVAEYCSGATTCPADAVAPSTTVCRGVAGDCDVAEQCTGSSKSCPVDDFVAGGTVCRASNGPCDVDEICSGDVAACPADSFKASSVVCRASAGICDVDEFCPGNGAACPGNSFEDSTTVCRSAAGPCDVDEFCSGGDSSCPADAFKPSSVVCRASGGICDIEENCDGSTAACPSDAVADTTRICRPSVSTCDPEEVCQGAGYECPVDMSGSFETACPGLAYQLDGDEYSFTDFDVISFNQFIGSNTGAIEGRLTARNNVQLGSGYSVGYSVNTANGDDRPLPYSLVAGGNVSWTSGAIFPSGTNGRGDAEDIFVGGGYFTGSDDLALRATGGPCDAPDCLGSQFDGAQSCYAGYQTSFAAHADNVQKLIEWSGLYLTCDSNVDKVHYLSLLPSEMSQYTWVSITNCNANAQWIINVRGSADVNLNGAYWGLDPSAVIFNVVGAGRTVNVFNVLVPGTILAPFNTLNQPSGQIDGRVIVADVVTSLNILTPGCRAF